MLMEPGRRSIYCGTITLHQLGKRPVGGKRTNGQEELDVLINQRVPGQEKRNQSVTIIEGVPPRRD